MIWLHIFIALLGATAHARMPRDISDFRNFCRKHRFEKTEQLPNFVVGKVNFLPTSLLQAQQIYFNYDRMLDKLKGVLDKPENSSGSVYGAKDAVRAVIYRGKIYMFDGHHDAMAATYVNSKTMPVMVEDDLSFLNEDDFNRAMEARGWSYLRWQDGSPHNRIDLCELINDPTLSLPDLFVHKVKIEVRNGKIYIRSHKGAKRVLVIKVGDDLPFFERILVDTLARQRQNIHLTHLTPQNLNNFLRALKRATVNRTLPPILILDEPTDIQDLDLQKLVRRHLKQAVSCQNLLSKPG